MVGGATHTGLLRREAHRHHVQICHATFLQRHGALNMQERVPVSRALARTKPVTLNPVHVGRVEAPDLPYRSGCLW